MRIYSTTTPPGLPLTRASLMRVQIGRRLPATMPRAGRVLWLEAVVLSGDAAGLVTVGIVVG